MTPDRAELNRILACAEQLHGPEDVSRALDRMAAEITRELGESLPVVLCVLTGGIIPTGHLLTRLAFPLEADYLHATRYRGGTSGHEVEWVSEPGISLQGRTVLVVDDILDEGHTLADVLRFCRQSGAAGIYSAVLVEKQHDRRNVDMRADFTGLQVDDRYVFGFGMDYKGYFRNLNGIFALGDN
ncbi:MAG TPA: hypoxanthine-guanine phosphoribosyltransferase [Gammaproteobacteria bacterium]|jgi:hypoxanthine phosphoribosyltransferase|nr:hypoxanthine-guanine phosphoribosyltransferase [Gammaproteobacteria bacterium]